MLAAQNDQEPEETASPELDDEAAADSAAPAEIVELPQQKVPLEEMWAMLESRCTELQLSQGFYRERYGAFHPGLARKIAVTIATANAITFLMEHETAIRNYMAHKRDSENRAAEIRRLRR